MKKSQFLISEIFDEYKLSKPRKARLNKMWAILINEDYIRYYDKEGRGISIITRKELAALLGMKWERTSCSAARTLSDDMRLFSELGLIGRFDNESRIEYIRLY